MLDEQYVPVGGGPPKPPPFPSRLRCVIFAFAEVADEDARKKGT